MLAQNSTRHLEKSFHQYFCNYSKQYKQKEYYIIHFMRPQLPRYSNHIKSQNRKGLQKKKFSYEHICNILSKSLSERIQESIRKIIHYDQLGFFLEMHGCFNIWKISNTIHIKIKYKKKHRIILLDVTKSLTISNIT